MTVVTRNVAYGAFFGLAWFRSQPQSRLFKSAKPSHAESTERENHRVRERQPGWLLKRTVLGKGLPNEGDPGCGGGVRSD
jgi:hypothetical protein